MFQRLILKVSNEQGSNYGSTAPAQKILPRFKAEAGKAAPPPAAGRLGVHGMAPTKSPHSVPFQPVTVAVAHVRISQ